MTVDIAIGESLLYLFRKRDRILFLDLFAVVEGNNLVVVLFELIEEF